MKHTEILTTENAPEVSTIESIENPEWGAQRFNYREQFLGDGQFAHTVGSGCNSRVLFESEMRYWRVVSRKH